MMTRARYGYIVAKPDLGLIISKGKYPAYD